MNAKIAKLLRKYCKVNCKDYRKYKKMFKAVSPEKKMDLIGHLKGAVK